MGWDLEPRLRTLLAMLCVALSFVFAGASAAGVVNCVQHSANVVHEHGAHLAFSVGEPDHHGDHIGGADHHDEDPETRDGQTSPGHHHADAPVGALSLNVESATVPVVAGLTLHRRGAPSRRGVRPGGLERPPKTDANLS